MKEKVSALMDGALDEHEAGQVCRALANQSELRQDWQTWQIIGDSLRGVSAVAPDMTASVMAQLEHEPTVLAPVARKPARNWTRVAMSMAATVFGVGLVVLMAQNMRQTDVPSPTLAAAPQALVAKQAASPTTLASSNAAQVKTSAAQPNGDRSREALQSFLMAHHGFSPSIGMQGVAPYVRTVAEVDAGGDR